MRGGPLPRPARSRGGQNTGGQREGPGPLHGAACRRQTAGELDRGTIAPNPNERAHDGADSTTPPAGHANGKGSEVRGINPASPGSDLSMKSLLFALGFLSGAVMISSASETRFESGS